MKLYIYIYMHMHTERTLSTTESFFCCMMRTGQETPIYRIGTMKDFNSTKCNAEFRFYKNDLYKLACALQLPDQFVMYNGFIVESIPALCIYLKRFSYPCRYSAMGFQFTTPVPEICIITNHTTDWIYNRWNHLLTTHNHNLLSQANLILYADAVHQSGALMELFGQCVDQVSIKEFSTVHTNGCIP